VPVRRLFSVDPDSSSSDILGHFMLSTELSNRVCFGVVVRDGGEVDLFFLCGAIPLPYGKISLSQTVPVLLALLLELTLTDRERYNEYSSPMSGNP